MGQDELMKRPDVTAAFILTSTIAILASAQVSTTMAMANPPRPLPVRETGLMVSGAIRIPDFASRGHDSSCRTRFPRDPHRPRRCGAPRLGHRCPSRRECHSHTHSQRLYRGLSPITRHAHTLLRIAPLRHPPSHTTEHPTQLQPLPHHRPLRTTLPLPLLPVHVRAVRRPPR